jgi:hypothetical protein
MLSGVTPSYRDHIYQCDVSACDEQLALNTLDCIRRHGYYTNGVRSIRGWRDYGAGSSMLVRRSLSVFQRLGGQHENTKLTG